MRSELLRMALAGLCLWGTAAVGQAPAGPFDELAVKAEFVQRFAEFTEWPEGTFSRGDEKFVICLYGRARIGPQLAKFEHERKIKGRDVEIRRVHSSGKLERCHVLWLPRGVSNQLPGLLARVNSRPILTIGDTEGYAERGVHIVLVEEEGRFGFAINLERARDAGLRLSSRLLRLGRVIGAGEGP